MSTGLLLLHSESIERQDTTLAVADSFNADSFTASRLAGTPLQTYFGIRTKGLPFPNGTSEELNFPFFQPLVSSLNTESYTAIVEGLSLDLQCEVAQTSEARNVGNLPWLRLNAPFLAVNLSTPSCKLNDVVVGQGPDQFDAVTRDEQYQGWWGNYTCGITSDLFPPGTVSVPDQNPDHRLIMTTSLVRWNTTGVHNRKVVLATSTSIICKPSYKLNQYRIQVNPQPTGAEVPFTSDKLPNTTRKLHRLRDGDLVPALMTVAAASQSLGSEGIVSSIGSTSIIRPPDQLFRLMQLIKGESDLHAFLDSSTLIKSGPQAFKGVWMQIANENLLQKPGILVQGTLTEQLLRLEVSTLAFGLLLCLFAFLTCIPIVLVYLRPHDCTPIDPSTISAATSLLSKSPDVQSYMGHAWTRSNMVSSPSALSGVQFVSNCHAATFGILCTSPGSAKIETSDEQLHHAAEQEWWCPLAFKTWYAILSILLPLLLAAILQILQYLSDSRDGLLDINSNKSRTVLIASLPAAVLACLAALTSSLHLSLMEILPFMRLRSMACDAKSSVSVNLVTKSYLEGMYWAIRRHTLSLGASVLAAGTASLLTIVASGLLFSSNVLRNTSGTVTTADIFDLGLNGNDLSQGDNLAAVIANLIVYENLSYPQWTFGNLAFPSLKPVTTDGTNVFTPVSFLEVTLPALRASLDCVKVPSHGVADVPNLIINQGSGLADITFNVRPEQLCAGVSNQSLLQPDSMQLIYSVPFNGSEVSIGSINDHGFTIHDEQTGPTLTNITRTRSCRTKSLVIGTIKASLPRNDSTTAPLLSLNVDTKLNAFACFQRVEEVQTRVRFSLPGFSIDVEHPPLPQEDTARFIQSPYYAGYDFAFSTTTDLSTALPLRGRNADQVDPFFQALTDSNIGVPFADLAADSAKLIAAANSMYGVYMAQAFNANFRVLRQGRATAKSTFFQGNKVETAPDTSFQATVIIPDRLRLKQSTGIKLALQIMLLSISICVAAVYLTSDATNVLPHNINLILGKMSLVCGTAWLQSMSEKDGSLLAPGNHTFGEKRKFTLQWQQDLKSISRYRIDFSYDE